MLGVGDPGPERVAGVRRQRVDGRPRPSSASAYQPRACQKRSLNRSRSAAARWRGSLGDRRQPHRLGQLGGAQERRVGVALHLHERDRSRRQGPVRRRDPVPRVLPALVGQPGGVAPAVVDEAVAVAVAGADHPVDRPIHRRRQLFELRRRERTPPPRLRRQHDEQRRGVDRAVVALAGRERPSAAVPAELVEDLAGLLLGRRVVDGALQLGQGCSTPPASVPSKGRVIQAVRRESRPKSVMNQGAPAAITTRSGWARSTMRRPARSTSAWSTTRRGGGRGTSPWAARLAIGSAGGAGRRRRVRRRTGRPARPPRHRPPVRS